MNLPIILDIEASGFGPEGYPIEIGFIKNDKERYCRLIKPYNDWTYWDKTAEKLHGISRDKLLKHGNSASEICLELNSLLKGETVYSDGWVVDSSWLNMLFDRSNIPKLFRLSSLEIILKEPQIEIWDATKISVVNDTHIERHRASNDALIIQKTFFQTLQKTESKITKIKNS